MSRDTVLVIDDDPDFRDLVCTIFLHEGIPVLGAGNWASGLETLDREKEHVGLILLDYWMPGMTPAAGAKMVREHAAGIDVVLVTAADDAGARAHELGIERWLAKPFELERLER